MRSARSIILLTDFGLEDFFVGMMEAAVVCIAPQARIISLSHSIVPGDIRTAAFLLALTYPYFPPKSVFCCVVDPGVGTERQPLCVQLGDYFFVAPDNGLLGPLISGQTAQTNKKPRIHAATQKAFHSPKDSHTFHGRDIFAPLAAHLYQGKALASLGPLVKETVALALPRPHIQQAGVLTGEVLYIDRFGNLITNIRKDDISHAFPSLGSYSSLALQLEGQEKEIVGFSYTYANKQQGEFLFYQGSCACIEIALNRGNAAQTLSARIGTRVHIKLNCQSSQ